MFIIMENGDGEFVYDSGEYYPIAFTLKRLKDPKSVSQGDYDTLLSGWLSRYGSYLKVYEPYFEYDSNNYLHAHGIMAVKKGFFKKKLQVPGFHVYTTDCYNVSQWLSYITKINATNKIDNKIYMF